MLVQAGATDVTTYFHLRLAADGTDATGLTITDIDLQYCRSGAAPTAKVDATALAAANSAHGDNQAFEIDGTDQPGVYRVDWPDAAFAAGVREVILTVKVATAFTESLRVQLIAQAGQPGTVDVNNRIAGIQGTINTLDALDTAQDAEHDATQSALATAQADLDTLTGADGATLATSQPNYAPAKAGDEMALEDDAITPAKLDGFGVAGKIDANITHANEVEVTGDGQSGTEWGPA